MAKETKLSARYQTFAENYVVHLNGSKAVISAGYAKKSANVTASKLLAKPNIQKEIQRLMDDRSEKTKITAEFVLNKLAIAAGVSMDDYVEFGAPITEDDVEGDSFETGRVRLKESKTLTKEQLWGINEISENATGGVKIKVVDKLRALEMLGRHLVLFTDKLQLDASENFSDLMIKLFDKK